MPIRRSQKSLDVANLFGPVTLVKQPETRMPWTRLGLQIAGYSFSETADRDIFERIALAATTAETYGFDSIWTMDHLHQIATLGGAEEGILEAYTVLAALAPLTKTALLGVLVSACGFRNPALLAKIVTSIDIISQGRAVLGIGAGWHEEEYRAYGYEFPSPRVRLEQLREAVQVCRAMFNEHAPTFSGKHFTVEKALNIPGPVRRGGPPIMIGGGGERVLIPLLAELGDGCNFFGAPATVRHKVEVLERACGDVGRDPSEITKTWLGHAVLVESEHEYEFAIDQLSILLGLSPQATPGFVICGTEDQITGQVHQYREAGIDGLIVTMLDPGDIQHLKRIGPLLRSALDG